MIVEIEDQKRAPKRGEMYLDGFSSDTVRVVTKEICDFSEDARFIIVTRVLVHPLPPDVLEQTYQIGQWAI